MRLIMMGTGPFAVPTFESLVAKGHQVLALVTRPAVSSQTRGKIKSPYNPMREAADRLGVPTIAPDSVNATESTRQLAEYSANLFVVCDYGQILSPDLLAVPPLGGINLHGSLLPKYRGAAPVNWAIWNGETRTGVTVIHMTPKLDAGPSLVQVETEIGPDETAVELERRLARMGVEPVHEAIAQLASWDRTSVLGTPQDKSLATRARRLRKSDGSADWSQPAEQVYRQFRAVQPWPGLFTHWHSPGREPLRIILDKIAPIAISTGCPLPGTVVRSDGKQLIVAASEGAIIIHRIQPAGGRVLDVAEFLRGYAIPIGDMMGG